MYHIDFKRISVVLITSLIISILMITVFLYLLLNKTTIYGGITIQGTKVSGLNRMEAIECLKKNYNNQLKEDVLVLRYNNYVYKVKYEELGVSYDYYKAVEEAYSVGRKGSFINRAKYIISTKKKGKNIALQLTYNDTKIDSLIEDVRKDLCINSENAKIELINGVFVITPESDGSKINVNIFKNKIIKGLLGFKIVEIPVEKEIPKITEKLLSKIKYTLSEFTTYFGGSSEARKNNIELASLKIDSTIILPGEIFSFNKVTGVRDQRAGYMESKVIVDGKFVNDIGGGVCQVSTTLYNVALKAGLEIVERHHHSIPVGYVPKGKDATVSYDYLDLKFKNNNEFPIYIQAIPTSYTVTFKMYGDKITENRYIEIETILEEKVNPQMEKTIDKNLKIGTTIIVKKGRYGYKVKTYRLVYENKKLIKRELISEDFYKPQKYILKIGPNNTQESTLRTDNPRARLVQ